MWIVGFCGGEILLVGGLVDAGVVGGVCWSIRVYTSDVLILKNGQIHFDFDFYLDLDHPYCCCYYCCYCCLYCCRQ